MPCQYCPAPTTIDNSHVVPDFVIQWMMENAPRREIFFSWERAGFAHEMITGPYFCEDCEGEFSRFEGSFRQYVFQDPQAATTDWSTGPAIRFMASLCYRYAIHHLFGGFTRDADEEARLVEFRSRAESVVRDPREVGKTLHIYPYAFRPIIAGSCDLAPGCNQMLAASFGMQLIGKEPPLPMVMIVRIPRISMIFAPSDLVGSGDTDFANYVQIQNGVPFEPVNSNATFPFDFARFINRSMGETVRHQRDTGRWTRFVIPEDEAAHPDRIVYQTRGWDRQLELWQEANCGQVERHSG